MSGIVGGVKRLYPDQAKGEPSAKRLHTAPDFRLGDGCMGIDTATSASVQAGNGDRDYVYAMFDNEQMVVDFFAIDGRAEQFLAWIDCSGIDVSNRLAVNELFHEFQACLYPDGETDFRRLMNLFNRPVGGGQTLLSRAVADDKLRVLRDLIATCTSDTYADCDLMRFIDTIEIFAIPLEASQVRNFLTILLCEPVELRPAMLQINKKDERGRTLLMRAVQRDDAKGVELLLNAGADPLVETARQRGTVVAAEWPCRYRICEALIGNAKSMQNILQRIARSAAGSLYRAGFLNHCAWGAAAESASNAAPPSSNPRLLASEFLPTADYGIAEHRIDRAGTGEAVEHDVDRLQRDRHGHCDRPAADS